MTSPIEMGAVVWSPRGYGAGEYPYDVAQRAAQFHATASLWVSGGLSQSQFNALRIITPRVGLMFNPAISSDTSALMIDVLTGQSMKPHWFTFAGAWFGCANRPTFLNAVADRLRTFGSWGVTDVQMDDIEINYQLSQGGSYLYGTGNVVGTNGAAARGCNCANCQAKASAIGYGTLNSTTIQEFARISVTNFWSVIGAEARSNGMQWSGNLRWDRPIAPLGYTAGRLHYPMFEEYSADVTGDRTITAWESLGQQWVGTLAVNTQSSYEQVFGSSDKTRRWMATRYAVGALPIAPWDVYAGPGVARVFAARQDVADLTGFVRAKGPELFDGFALAGAVGETKRWPVVWESAAWADTTNVFVTVRYRDSDGRRIIHAVDLRDTPVGFSLSWWPSVVGAGSVVSYQPATYNLGVQDAAVSSGNRSALVVTNTPTVTGTITRSVTLSAGLWRVLEVAP